MATDYQLEVPAATKSATGATLAAAKRWSFKTPPPTVKSSYPNGGPFSRDPLIFVEFDQAIVPCRCVKDHSSARGEPRMADKACDQRRSRGRPGGQPLAAAAEKGRWLAFRVVDLRNNDSPGQLPADAYLERNDRSRHAFGRRPA